MIMKTRQIAVLLLAISLGMAGCGKTDTGKQSTLESLQQENVFDQEDDPAQDVEVVEEESEVEPAEEETEDVGVTSSSAMEETVSEDIGPMVSEITWDENWEYADHSIIHDDSVTLFRATAGERKNVVVTVNAGHGTVGGSSVKTLCHPDGSAKVTGGSTAAGSIRAIAVSSGTTMLDGTPEGQVTLSLALLVKDTLLQNGYDVLMIRETDDAQIDNVARTVYANNNSDCHIALHYNSTDYDAGFFYIGVPDIASYKEMEPVASHWQEHNAFGAALLEGIKQENVKVCGDGFMGMDLTQTSYSTVPSTDVEVGDRGSDYSQETQQHIADGILAGLNIWCEQRED